MSEFDRQVDALIAAGHPAAAGLSAAEFHDVVAPLRAQATGPAPTRSAMPFALVVKAPATVTMAHTALRGRPGFVDRLAHDVDTFTALPELAVPDAPVYLLLGAERGEEFCAVVPDDALRTIAGRGRTPLTVAEGIALLTLFPDILERNRCFSLGGSRCGDRRVPALWISNRAPKLGWCWAGNPHTWLGMASAAGRTG